eukprot:GFYU01049370.1.p1 GENE.GFYU01049370.1~~GFYU01049370.1.p1  ORF type:complete len:322 (-),score=60.43 GFYU01049370.1:45-1010(-)
MWTLGIWGLGFGGWGNQCNRQLPADEFTLRASDMCVSADILHSALSAWWKADSLKIGPELGFSGLPNSPKAKLQNAVRTIAKSGSKLMQQIDVARLANPKHKQEQSDAYQSPRSPPDSPSTNFSRFPGDNVISIDATNLTVDFTYSDTDTRHLQDVNRAKGVPEAPSGSKGNSQRSSVSGSSGNSRRASLNGLGGSLMAKLGRRNTHSTGPLPMSNAETAALQVKQVETPYRGQLSPSDRRMQAASQERRATAPAVRAAPLFEVPEIRWTRAQRVDVDDSQVNPAALGDPDMPEDIAAVMLLVADMEEGEMSPSPYNSDSN